jgi:hypothetical protein
MVELELLHARSVEGPGRFQPSGLGVRDGVLFTVSDKDSETIFRVEMEGEFARCIPAVTFAPPQPMPETGWLDLEAIVPTTDGGFDLASEEAVRLLRVPPGGGQAVWITPDLRPAGQVVGLLAEHNAYCEGLALTRDGTYLVAAERAPRGLVELWIGSDPWRLSAQRMDQSRFPIPEGRGYDISDLVTHRGRIFALARNQHLIVEFVRGPGGAWREAGTAWSYRATEVDPRFAFAEKKWGIAEGLAFDGRLIHVVVDNGATGRAADPGDSRPWLWSFRNVIAE